VVPPPMHGPMKVKATVCHD